MPSARAPFTLTIGHSPDADDAFMWWPLQGAVGTGRFRFEPVPEDIEALNRRAVERADLDITAMSFHAYARARGAYALTTCGASVGDGYGPKVVAREAHDPAWLASPGLTIAIPGERTTAFLVLRLMVGKPFRFVAAPFHEVCGLVRSGRVDAGVVIHEAQLTYAEEGLAAVADLGAWWRERTGLPLPLGANAVRRDLDERFGRGAAGEVAAILRRSIEHALASRDEGLRHAAKFAPGVALATASRFVSMYVNGLTLDLGVRGREAVGRLLREGAAAGFCPAVGEVDFVSPEPAGPIAAGDG